VTADAVTAKRSRMAPRRRPTGLRRRRHQPRRRGRGRGGAARGQFEIPGIGYGAVDERRIVRSDGATAVPRSGCTFHLSSDWHNLPAGTEILLALRPVDRHGSRGDREDDGGTELTPGVTAPGDRGGAATTTSRSSTHRSCRCPQRRDTHRQRRRSRDASSAAAGRFTLTPPRPAPQARRAGYVPPSRRAHTATTRQLPRRTRAPTRRDLFAAAPAVVRCRRVCSTRAGPLRRLPVGRGHRRTGLLANLRLCRSRSTAGGSTRRRRRFVGNTGDAARRPRTCTSKIHRGPVGVPRNYLQGWRVIRTVFGHPSRPPAVAGTQLIHRISPPPGSRKAGSRPSRGRALDTGLVASGPGSTGRRTACGTGLP